MREKITIPESQKEIPLHKFQEFMEGYIEENDDHNKLLAFKVFLGIDFKKFNKMRVEDIDGIWRVITIALNEQPKLTKTFEHEGVEYGFIPDINAISWGEYIDAEAFFTDPKNYHKLLAVLYRPVIRKKGELYDIENYTGLGNRPEIFKNVSLAIYSGVAVFFYHLSKALLETTRPFSTQREEATHSP